MKSGNGLWGVVLAGAIASFAFVHVLWSQELVQSSPLVSSQTEVDRLAPDVVAGQAEFRIDDCELIRVEIVATQEVVTRVEGPSGQDLNEETVAAFGGQFGHYELPQGGSGPLIMPLDIPGFHYVFSFPSLGAGTYRVHFQAPGALSEEVAVVTQVLTDSPVGISLIATQPELKLGNIAVLSALVFERSAPVSGASVSVVVRPESGEPIQLVLRDDGGSDDDAAGDGIYSGEFVPSSAGRYSAFARIEGVTSGGVAFHAENATEFDVFSPKGRLVGEVEDRGVDEDGDGVFDGVRVEVGAEVLEAGQFKVFVHLATAGGKKLMRTSGEVTLSQGTHSVPVDFEGSALLELAEDGPYEIRKIEMDVIEERAPFTVDEREDVGQTRAYLLSQFRPLKPGGISGMVTDEATGEPLLNVEVLVYDINGSLAAIASTDGAGRYRVGGVLHPGNYLATTKNIQGFIDEIYDGITCEGLCGSPDRTGTLIRVEAGVETPSIDFALAK